MPVTLFNCYNNKHEKTVTTFDNTISKYMDNANLQTWDTDHIDQLITIISKDLLDMDIVFVDQSTNTINCISLGPGFGLNIDNIKY
jgi:hypothetical protein